MPTTSPFMSWVAGAIGPLALAAAVALGAPSDAVAQAPTKAQQSAIRSACPADYRSYCASVPPGGKAALDCLQQNATKLSDACRSAVQAAGSSAAAAPAPAPAASANPDATTPAPDPGSAKGKSTGAAKSPPPVAAAPAPTPKPAVVVVTPRQELALVRQACGPDFRAHCRNVPLGGGNAVACLKENAASLSPRCQKALASFAR